jgi:hypothetical protein
VPDIDIMTNINADEMLFHLQTNVSEMILWQLPKATLLSSRS